MCRQLDELENSILGFAKGFDASALAPTDASLLSRRMARWLAALSSVRSLAATRAAESSSWQDEGYRSAAEHIAHHDGISTAAARQMLRTGEGLTRTPELARAAQSGELSVDQASLVAAGAQADPSKTAELIDAAKKGSLKELHGRVAEITAASEDADARRQRVHARRCLKRWTDLDGITRIRSEGHPEDAARFLGVVETLRRRLVILRREAGVARETLTALDYDALHDLIRLAAGDPSTEITVADLLELGLFPTLFDVATAAVGASEPEPAPLTLDLRAESSDDIAGPPPDGQGAPPTAPGRRKRRRPPRVAGSRARITVRVDLDALLRGAPIDGELCEIVGYGPVSVAVIDQLAQNHNTFIAAVLTRSQRIVGVYHHSRRPRAHQKTALDFLHPTCAVAGCDAEAGLQYDHRDDWARTHFTIYDLLDRLCWHHHQLKTRKNWALVEGVGKREFVPPGHVRHPGVRPMNSEVKRC